MAYHLKNKKNRPINIGATKAIAMLFSIAHEKGFFFDRKVNLKVNFVSYARRSMELMIDGELCAANLVEINVAYLGYLKPKTPIKCIASLEQRSADGIVMRHEQNLYPTPNDLLGKTIGFMPRTTSHVFLMRFLETHNIPKHAVTLKPITPQAMPNALIRSEVDAISIWQPYAQQTTTTMHELGLYCTHFKNAGIYKAEVVLAVTKPFLIKNRKACENMIAALRDAEQYIDDNPTEAYTLLLDKMGMNKKTLMQIDAEEYQSTFELIKPKLKPIGDNFLKNLEFSGKWISEEDTQFKGQPIPDYKDYIDNSLFS